MSILRCYKPLRDKFQRLNIPGREWHRKSGYPRSLENMNVVLMGRPQAPPVEPISFAYLALCLGFNNQEIADLIRSYLEECPQKAKEIRLLLKLIGPSELDADIRDAVTIMQRLPKEKLKTFVDMLTVLDS